ncbi:hypothetical protein HYU18_01890 [Candidatus Woesearchaeota archaeon]|nr:hypothetical protein [Candidatus Woesearchaeota archaeon]
MTEGVTVRAVNRGLWRELKVTAVKEGITLGEAVNLAIQKWLHEQKEAQAGNKHKSFWSLRPFKFEGADKEKLSTLVDETLYG